MLENIGVLKMSDREDMPQEIQILIGRCEINEIAFDNADMSSALKFAEEMFDEVERLREALRLIAANTSGHGLLKGLCPGGCDCPALAQVALDY